MQIIHDIKKGDFSLLNSNIYNDIIFTVDELAKIERDAEIQLDWETDELSVVIYENGLKAFLFITFKKPFPNYPPEINFIGPKYGNHVDIKMSIVFEPILSTNWKITSSLVDILKYILENIHENQPIASNLTWDKDELCLIKFMEKIGGFKNKSDGIIKFFESTKKHIGLGYSSGQIAENSFNDEGELNSLLIKLHDAKNAIIDSRIIDLNIEQQLNWFIQNTGYLFLDKIKENLMNFIKINNLEKSRQLFLEKSNHINLHEKISKSKFIFNIEFDDHYFKKEKIISSNAPSFIKRLMLELCDLDSLIETLHDDSIVFIWDINNPQFSKFFIIPASGTPYYGGYFEFHMYLPVDYPLQNPKVQFMTTNFGTVRFNPNLYACGKVCLSLLGTWAGEKWNPKESNLTQVIYSISTMIFNQEPLTNEPAYSEYYEDSKNGNYALIYKQYIRYETLAIAIIPVLQSTNNSINTYYKTYFEKNKDKLINEFNEFINDYHEITSTYILSGQIMRKNVFLNYVSEYKKLISILEKII